MTFVSARHPNASEARASNARQGEGLARLCRVEGGGKAPV